MWINKALMRDGFIVSPNNFCLGLRGRQRVGHKIPMMWTGLEPHGWWELDLAGGVQRVTMLGCKIQSKVSVNHGNSGNIETFVGASEFSDFFFESLRSFFVLKICDSSHHVIAPSDYINAGAVVFFFFFASHAAAPDPHGQVFTNETYLNLTELIGDTSYRWTVSLIYSRKKLLESVPFRWETSKSLLM